MNENITLIDYIIEHCNKSMAIALSAERCPLWSKSCAEMNDIDFICFGLLRGIGAVDSGRHFLQTREAIHGEHLPLSTYFKSLKSHRRTIMLEMFEKQSYALHGETLAWLEIDYLRPFQERDQYIVAAADGCFIGHACHAEKVVEGKVYATGFIYSMNLRNGLLKALCCITNGTKRNHEIPVLLNHIEKQNKEANKPEKRLYLYDKAVTDYVWWNYQIRHENYMISALKENSVATFFESIPFDKSNKINIGVEGYSIYENGGIKFSVVDYRDPETQKCHRFVTTLPTASINPGLLPCCTTNAGLWRKRSITVKVI